MKAVYVEQPGSADTLIYGERPRPQIRAGEVLVRVHAAGVNPVDWKTRQNGPGNFASGDPFPFISGWDISGVVEEVAPDVTAFKVGDEVYGMVNFPGIGAAYAEYVASPAAHLAHKPETLDHIGAAALPLAVLTAWQSLFDTAGLQSGQSVLVLGASGGVGHLAVQLAKWKGAHVVGTASARNADLLRELGVDDVIDYNAGPLKEQIGPVDVALNTVSPQALEEAYGLVRPGGFLVSVAGRTTPEQAEAHGIRAASILVASNGSQLADIAQLVDAGQVKPYVGAVFDLRDTAQAHELSQTGRARGKIVLRVV
jgi:NADPH:quinone reductase-like Zn-dependent oxidoreductase